MLTEEQVEDIEKQIEGSGDDLQKTLDALGLKLVASEVEPELSLVRCARCGVWTHAMFVVDEVCEVCEDDGEYD